MSKDKATEVKDAILNGAAKEPPRRFLSTGSTLVNLALAGRPFGGLMCGGHYLVVGDSSAGKTVLAGTCLAEAAMNPKFNHYALRFDNAEDGALMFEPFFGDRIGRRIKSPMIDDKGQPLNSRTVEEFYYNHHTTCGLGSNVYVLDSENALTSDAERKKQAQKRKDLEADEEGKGTMTDGKAKIHSQCLRGAIADNRDTGSILMMLCQSREAMGFGAMFEPKTRAGGKALKFYAQGELWFSIVARIKKNVRGKDREIGIIARVAVKKNRITGKNRTVDIPIYHSFGIDDLGSCITWLTADGVKHWTKTGGIIKAPELNFEGKASALIQHIETNNLERDLRTLTGEVWQEIEQELEVVRKPRYQ